jgi:hypothetical protein
MNLEGVVLFHTSSSAIRAEKVLMRASVAVKLIPTPRELSSDCGIALGFQSAASTHVVELLNGARVEIAGIHQWSGGKWI